MSDKRAPIKEIIMEWRVRHNDLFYPNDRQDQIKQLFSNFIYYGYKKEDITPSIKKSIVDVMYNHRMKTAKEWRRLAEKDFDFITRQFWPMVELVEHNPQDIVAPPIKHEPELQQNNMPEERFLDLARLSEGIETTPIEEDRSLEELLGIKRDGRSD
jgi:hypothetical protein